MIFLLPIISHVGLRPSLTLGCVDLPQIAPLFPRFGGLDREPGRELVGIGICEALGRPNMRFVAVKTVDQQSVLSRHRAREAMVSARTAEINRVRGLLAEFGIVVALGLRSFTRDVPAEVDVESEIARGQQPAAGLQNLVRSHWLSDLGKICHHLASETKRGLAARDLGRHRNSRGLSGASSTFMAA